MPRSARQLKKALEEELANGNISLGRLISPKTFSKLVIDKETNEIRSETFITSGRKIPIREIREKINEDHFKLGILRPSPILHRNLSVWADHSTILSHGYLLLTVKPIYSKDVYLTNKEMEESKGGSWNVQELVEKPSVYIFARADDSILEKLSYVETRAEDIKNLSLPTEINGQTVKDTLRFFQGDHPEIQFESGNQQGGHFPCLCGVKIDQFSNLNTILRSEVRDLATCASFLKKGPAGRTGGAKPYEKLKAADILEELRRRDPPGWQDCRDTKERECFLKNHMQGVARIPSLLFGNHLELEDIPKYEVSPCEPLHDLKGHIKNLWDILVYFLNDDEKKIFEETLECCNGGKDKLKGCDYR